MRPLILLVLFSTAACYAQLPANAPGQSATASSKPQSTQTRAITIPSGTIIPAKLVTQISVKARPGDSVRAITTFPVTVGTQTVIPAGTYLEGVVQKLNRRAPSVEMRFTELLFANGYTVPMTGEQSEEKAANYYRVSVVPNSHADMPLHSEGGPDVDLAAAQEGPFPPAPSLPPMHSHIGAFVGIAVGVTVGSIVAVILLHHYRGNGETVLFDAGWPFEIVLTQPAFVDAATITSILAAPSGN